MARQWYFYSRGEVSGTKIRFVGRNFKSGFSQIHFPGNYCHLFACQFTCIVNCSRLKRYLSGRGIRFRQRDLLMDEDAAEHLEAHNIYSSPALEVNGEILAGDALSPERLDALFAD